MANPVEGKSVEELVARIKSDVLTPTATDVYPEFKKHIPQSGSEDLAEFYEIMNYYPDSKGKYGRPSLTLLTCETLGGKRSDAFLTAAAMQCSEEWILMRDDWEDSSLLRRDQPCAHRKFGDFKANNGADGLHVLMWDMLNRNDELVGYEKGKKIRAQFAYTLAKTVEGQHREIDWVMNGKIGLSPEEWYKVADTKTGWYTIITPMKIGAMVAGASEEKLKQIEEIGIPLGRAFQLRDDALNVMREVREKYGKEIGGDIIEGKRTVPLGHLYLNCSGEDRVYLTNLLINTERNDRKYPKDSDKVIDLMEKYGSIKYAQNLAIENAQIAIDLFDKYFVDVPESKAKTNLRDLILFFVYRDQ